MKKVIFLYIFVLISSTSLAQSGFMMDLGDGIYYWSNFQQNTREYYNYEASTIDYEYYSDRVLGGSVGVEQKIRGYILEVLLAKEEADVDNVMAKDGYIGKTQNSGRKTITYHLSEGELKKEFSIAKFSGRMGNDYFEVMGFYYTTNDTTEINELNSDIRFNNQSIGYFGNKENFVYKVLRRMKEPSGKMYYIDYPKRSPVIYFKNNREGFYTYVILLAQ